MPKNKNPATREGPRNNRRFNQINGSDRPLQHDLPRTVKTVLEKEGVWVCHTVEQPDFVVPLLSANGDILDLRPQKTLNPHAFATDTLFFGPLTASPLVPWYAPKQEPDLDSLWVRCGKGKETMLYQVFREELLGENGLRNWTATLIDHRPWEYLCEMMDINGWTPTIPGADSTDVIDP